MLDYKISSDDLYFSSSAFSSPQKDDTPFDDDSAKALQFLKNLKNFYPDILRNYHDFSTCPIGVIQNSKSFVDSSTYINSDLLSDLIAILKSEECIDRSQVLEIIYSLSKFDKVIEFLNHPDIIHLLYTIALSQDDLQKDNYIALRILTRLLPHVENNEIYLTDHPINEFYFLSELDEVVPLFTKFIELHPNQDQFRSISQFIYEKTEFECYKDIIMMLKSVLPVYPEEINFLIELATPGLPCFLRRLTARILRDDEIEEDIESLTGLMEAFIVPLTSNIMINEDVFLIIKETNLVCNAFRYFMYIDCGHDSQWSAIRFFEICTSHDFLHKEALYSVTDCDFTDIVDASHNREFEQQIHFIVIISNLIQQQLRYNAAELAIEYDILTLISSFIPDHIQYALNALDVLIEKYVEHGQGKAICDLIGETSIIQDLKDATEDNDIDDEFEIIVNFVNRFNNIANSCLK